MDVMGDSVYERLREEITSGSLDADSSLAELSLATRYNVSRTPIREALRQLEQDGLVERTLRGTRIRSLSPEDVIDIYDVRIPLEQAAAVSAAQRHSTLDLAKLRQVHEELTRIGSTDAAAARRLADSFHEILWQASHNAVLIDVLVRVQIRLSRVHVTTLGEPERLEQVTSEHGEILTAITAGDGNLAGNLAAEHMARSRALRVEHYSRESATTDATS